MNRRGFLARLCAAPIVALVAIRATPTKAAAFEPKFYSGVITYRGIPFHIDPQCPTDRVYLLPDRAAFVAATFDKVDSTFTAQQRYLGSLMEAR